MLRIKLDSAEERDFSTLGDEHQVASALSAGRFGLAPIDPEPMAPNQAPTIIIAPPFRLGGETLVNTFTSGLQGGPDVATLSGGDYVVVWSSSGQEDVVDVYGQRYDGGGVPKGAEFRINATLPQSQGQPAIAALASGGFVVSWTSFGQDGSLGSIHAQRFDANGVPQGPEFRVNTFTTNYQEVSDVAGLSGGGFVVAWESIGQDGGDNGVYAQRYNASGVAQGAEFRVNATTTGSQRDAALAGLSGGGFVVVWQSFNQDGSGDGVYAQRYDALGAAQGGEFRVNTTTPNSQNQASIVALADGGFVIVWSGFTPDGSNSEIFAQRYNASGVAQGGEFQVNVTTANTEGTPSITALSPSGGFVVTWRSDGQDGDGGGIYGRRFNAAGVAQGEEFRVNTTTADAQQLPAIAATSEDGFVIAWQGSLGPSEANIYTQRYGQALIVTEQQPQSLKSVVAIADADAGTGGMALTLAVGFGTLSATPGTSGVNVSGSGTATLTVTGTLGQLQAFLANDPTSTLVYQQTSDAPPATATLSVILNDNGNTGDDGPKSVNLDVPINIKPVNDAPLGQDRTINAEEDVPYVFSLSDFPFTDPEGHALLSVTIDTLPSFGTLLLNGIGLLPGQGVNAASIAAGEFTFVAPSESSGSASFLFRIRDNGGVPNGGADTDPTANTFLLNVNAINDAPNLTIASLPRFAPVGGELPVNTATAGDQGAPAVAALLGGGSVVAWSSFGQDGSALGIYAQRYNAAGAPLGAEFPVNTTTENSQFEPSVAGLADGGFVVAWSSNAQDGSGLGVYAQMYNADGTKQAVEFRANSFLTDSQQAPSVSALNSGGFVIAWSSAGQDGSGSGIYAQRYDINGNPAGPEFRVNSTAANNQDLPSVAGLADGGFLVAWQSVGQDGSGTGIYAQRYDAFGVAQGSEFRLNTVFQDAQLAPSVAALSGGGFVVTWVSNLQDGDGLGIYAQRYDSSGVAQGTEFRVNATAANNQASPVASALVDGGFFIAWQSFGQDGSSDGVYGQRYNSSGVALGAELLVNSRTSGAQGSASASGLADGSVLVAWQSQGQDGSGSGVHAQRLEPALQIAEGGVLDLKGRIAVEDVDSGSAAVSVTLAISYGVLNANAGSSGVSFAGNGTGSLVITGTEAQIQAFLNTNPGSSLAYFASSDAAPDMSTLTVTANDNGNSGAGGARTTTRVIPILITPVADAFEFIGTPLTDSFTAPNANNWTIYGLGSQDTLFGAGGNDLIFGGTGDDTINGGTGMDVLNGGAGNDIFLVFDSSGDRVVEAAGEGRDVVYTTVNYALSADQHVEGLAANDAASLVGLTLTGNNLAQDIAGTAGADVLIGRGGADLLLGRGGDDAYYITDAAARVYELAGGGRDSAYTTVHYSLGTGVDVEALAAADAASLVGLALAGNALAQDIAGTAGPDVLNGGGGADLLVGRGGDDIYYITDPAARVYELAGGGRDAIYTTVNYELTGGHHVEVLAANNAASTVGLTLIGNERGQDIAGTAGADLLIGRGGADLLVGRGGDDVYIVIDAAERVYEEAGGGRDTVYTTVSYQLTGGHQIEVLAANNPGSTVGLTLIGNEHAQDIGGTAGADLLISGGGADLLVGRGGNDAYIVTDAATRVYEEAGGGQDVVYARVSYTLTTGHHIEGLAADNAASTVGLSLTGNEFAQDIAGTAGGDTLNGLGGADFLIGRGGADTFAFTTALGGGNVDRIWDMVSGVDRIALDDAVFTGLGLGTLNPNAFRVGTTAQDADDRIIYDQASGTLLFDADGAGGAAPIQFATLAAGTALLASDFVVI